MKAGYYRYEQGENPYDRGHLIVYAEEHENTIFLKMEENDLTYSTYVDVLFGDKRGTTIKKKNSLHAVRTGEEWFVVYPNRAGVSLFFEYIEEEAKLRKENKGK